MNAIAAVALAALLGAEPQDQSIRVSPGTQQILKIANLTRVAVADPSIADVTVTGQGGELLVLGKKKGRTSLTVWVGSAVTTRMVVVDDGRYAELAEAVREKVNASLKADAYVDKLVIEGTVDSLEQYGRLKKLVGDDPKVVLFVKLNPAALPAIASQINAELQRAGLPHAKAVVRGQKIVLEGTVSDPEEKQKAQLIADAYYSDFLDSGR